MNGAGTSNESRLVVGRWLNTYVVPIDHPHPDLLRKKLDAEFESRLGGTLAQVLGRSLNPADPAVWRIRQLHLSFAVPVNGSQEDSAAHFGSRQLAAQLVDLVSRKEENDSILRFPNRAAYLSQFALDLAAGKAWGKWYYLEFQSLSVLPAGAAIAEALIREPDSCAASVRHAASLGRLEEILGALTETNAGKIFRACFTAPGVAPPSELNRWAGRLLELWNESPLRPAASNSRHRDALRLLARAMLQFPDAEGRPGVQQAIDALLDFRGVVLALSPITADRLIQMLASKDRDAISGFLRQAGIESLRPAVETFRDLMDGDLDWAGQAMAVLLNEQHQGAVAVSASSASEESFLSHCAGIFLLGPAFVESGLDEIIRASTRAAENSDRAAAALRHFVVLKCLGRFRAVVSRNDAAVRLFSGVRDNDFPDLLLEPACVDAECVPALLAGNLASSDLASLSGACQSSPADGDYFSAGAWADVSIPPAIDLAASLLARAVLKQFARRLLGFHAASPEHLYQNFLAGTGAIRVKPMRIEIQLPQSPLAIVLQLSGAWNQTYVVPWLREREICLLPPPQ